ncbi:MAG: tRNA (guanosine(37)-N1)-methyltransferase TrmD [Sphaerochaetaceae bacterium]|nr:tRNA (guanosine(37)-N1)-methyltransferase TrmD [Sphaerochaetaceae bacterium]
MKIEIATLFPEMCESVLAESIIGRARKKGAVDISCRNIRDYTKDRHRRVDDTPYGGGMGMVMQADPIFNCFEAVCEELGERPHTVYMTPKGRVFTQSRAVELAEYKNILIICGHYEGVDQRVLDEIVDEEISIGDYVLTGGELPALVVADAVSRMCEGVLSDELCFQDESHFNGLLEYPQYTKPAEWHGMAVPEVLLSGHHKNIENFRFEKSIEITRERRPDMYENYIKSHKMPRKK